MVLFTRERTESGSFPHSLISFPRQSLIKLSHNQEGFSFREVKQCGQFLSEAGWVLGWRKNDRWSVYLSFEGGKNLGGINLCSMICDKGVGL